MSRQTLVTLVVIAAVLLVLGYVAYQSQRKAALENSDAYTTLGNPDEVKYTTLDGQEANLSDFDGTVRVVNSWASWSPQSRTELLELNTLGEQYADQGVNIIAINRNEDPIRAQRFLDQLGDLPYVNFLVDTDDMFYERMDGKAMPETLFFDKNGTILTHARGDLSFKEMEAALEAILQQQ